MAAGLPALTTARMSGAAEAYPTRRVTIINQFAPGSISDAAARLMAQSLQDQLGQSFIVENKVGAGGLVAATAGHGQFQMGTRCWRRRAHFIPRRRCTRTCRSTR